MEFHTPELLKCYQNISSDSIKEIYILNIVKYFF